MEVDNTLAEIIMEVQKRTKEKFNIDITFEETVEIIDVQITATAFGFARNLPIYWKGFLKFIWTNRRARNLESKDLFNTIFDKNNNLSPKELEYYTYLARVTTLKSYKQLEALGIHSKALTVKEVKSIPSNSTRFKNFKPLVKNRKP